MYAQKAYGQIQGINGRYRIADIGCFLTAFCNLQADFSYDVNPIDLDNYFKTHSVYVDVDDGIRDDLGWSSITALDPHTTVGRTNDRGTSPTAGWPSSNHSIVRFHYRSVSTGQMIFHFCKVHDAANRLIVDSWDGQIKTSPYGEPTAWAEYNHDAPAPAAPAGPAFQVVENYNPGKQIRLNKQPTQLWGMNFHFDYMKDHPIETHNQGEVWMVTNKVKHENGYYYYRRDGQVDGFNVLDCDDYTPPPPEPVAEPKSQLPQGSNFPGTTEQYEVVKTVPAYTTSGTAARSILQKGEVVPGIYFVYNKYNGMVNVSRVQGQPGSWINPGDNVKAPEPEPDYTVVTVEPNWGVIAVLRAAGYPEASATNIKEWDRLAAFNGSSERLKFKPGQQVKVPKAPLPLPAEVPEPVPVPVVAPAAAPVPEPAPVVTPEPAAATPEPTPEPAKEPEVVVPDWKDSWLPFRHNVIYDARKEYTVEDIEGKQSPRSLHVNQEVPISGTFAKGSTLYARVANSRGYWYGIPLTIKGEAVRIIEDPFVELGTPRPTSTRDFVVQGIALIEKLMLWVTTLGQKTKT